MMFPILFALSKTKEAWIADLWEKMKGKGVWNFHFARNLNDWKLDFVVRFLLQLQGHLVNREACWGKVLTLDQLQRRG